MPRQECLCARGHTWVMAPLTRFYVWGHILRNSAVVNFSNNIQNKSKYLINEGWPIKVMGAGQFNNQLFIVPNILHDTMDKGERGRSFSWRLTYFYFILVILGTKSRVLHMVGKCSVAEPHPHDQPTVLKVHSKMNIGHREVVRSAGYKCNSKGAINQPVWLIVDTIN